MTHLLGKYGEDVAERYLVGLGHVVVDKNYRCRFGEVDLITRYGGIFHFVEVKTVYHTDFHPLEQITPNKMNRIVRTVYSYIKQKKLGDCDFSIDGLGIILSKGQVPEIYYEENITL